MIPVLLLGALMPTAGGGAKAAVRSDAIGVGVEVRDCAVIGTRRPVSRPGGTVMSRDAVGLACSSALVARPEVRLCRSNVDQVCTADRGEALSAATKADGPEQLYF